MFQIQFFRPYLILRSADLFRGAKCCLILDNVNSHPDISEPVTQNFPGVQCPEMNELPYGRVYGNLMTYGNRIGFRCDYGYTLVGSEQRLCLSDGTWSGTDPTCVRGYFSSKF